MKTWGKGEENATEEKNGREEKKSENNIIQQQIYSGGKLAVNGKKRGL